MQSQVGQACGPAWRDEAPPQGTAPPHNCLRNPMKHYTRRNATTAFNPPNANEFDNAYSICASRD